MKTGKENKLLEIFAGTALEANIVKSLLENAEIEAFLKDELIGSIFPWHAAPGGAGAVKIYVSNTDVEKAMEVVEEYEKNLKK